MRAILTAVLCSANTLALAQPVIDVTSLGAVADGETDCAPAIQQAIVRAEGTGGTVRIPAAEQPYLLRSGLTIAGDDVTIEGEGATLFFADGAAQGEIVDIIQIVGTEDDPAEDVTIRGLTIDANYWNQPGAYNPRGIDSQHATRLTIENVRIDRAFVGMTFGRGVRGSVARGVTVTRWYDDAFSASGDDTTRACTGIRFENCTAADSPNEIAGGLPGNRDDAWEIEDGADRILLNNCVVRNCGGNGFAVRNHAGAGAVTTSAISFGNCTATGVAGYAFLVYGGSAERTVENIRLTRCVTDGVSNFNKDVRDLRITASVFKALVTLGPARDAVIEKSVFNTVRVWSFPVAGSEERPGYEPSVTFRACVLAREPWVYGDRDQVTLERCGVADR